MAVYKQREEKFKGNIQSATFSALAGGLLLDQKLGDQYISKIIQNVVQKGESRADPSVAAKVDAKLKEIEEQLGFSPVIKNVELTFSNVKEKKAGEYDMYSFSFKDEDGDYFIVKMYQDDPLAQKMILQLSESEPGDKVQLSFSVVGTEKNGKIYANHYVNVRDATAEKVVATNKNGEPLVNKDGETFEVYPDLKNELFEKFISSQKEIREERLNAIRESGLYDEGSKDENAAVNKAVLKYNRETYVKPAFNKIQKNVSEFYERKKQEAISEEAKEEKEKVVEAVEKNGMPEHDEDAVFDDDLEEDLGSPKPKM